MQDEQFKAFLNTMISGFNDTIKAVSKSSADHDLLIEIKAILANSLERQECNHKEFLSHKVESTPIRDAVKKHESWISGMSKAMWIVFGSLIALIWKVFFYR